MEARFSVVQQDEVVTIRLTGDVDLAVDGPVRDAVAGALNPGPERLLIDLSEVTFIDSTGLSLLIAAERAAEEAGAAFAVIGQLSREVQLVLELSGQQRLRLSDFAG